MSENKKQRKTIESKKNEASKKAVSDNT